jgi:aryl carrier-like protein
LVDGCFVEALSADYLDVVQRFVDAPHAQLGVASARFTLESAGVATSAQANPASHTEATRRATALERVWSDLFEGNTPALHDDLFEAGASSFDVVRFVDAARAAGHALEIADVFAAPTFTQLGARLDARASCVAELRDGA